MVKKKDSSTSYQLIIQVTMKRTKKYKKKSGLRVKMKWCVQ